MSKWYVTIDKQSSYIDEPDECVWTVSRDPNTTGWCTDSGYSGYGLTKADAEELANAANEIERLRERGETTEWFWRIVDADGLGNVPSDEAAALNLLVWKANLDDASRKREEALRAALHEWDALIEHQYSGSREAMSDMTYAAQRTAHLLYGDEPWPEPRRAALGEASDDAET